MGCRCPASLITHQIKNWFALVFVLALAGCSGGGFISGNFVLAPESPLPAWFKPTQDKMQFQIDIYETTFTSVGDVWVKVVNSEGKVVEKVKGKWGWHPETLARPRTQYPKWGLIRIRGTTEIYEQREPTNVLSIVKSVPTDKK